jgi:hypothetical protein
MKNGKKPLSSDLPSKKRSRVPPIPSAVLAGPRPSSQPAAKPLAVDSRWMAPIPIRKEP